MLKALIFLIEMIFLHCIADYYLQGILAKMKQKVWWANELHSTSELNRSKYKDDYKAALFAHSAEWSFMILIPMLYLTYYNNYTIHHSLMYVMLFIYNLILHSIIDNTKANKRKLNLIADQELHLVQIIFTWLLWWGVIGWN